MLRAADLLLAAADRRSLHGEDRLTEIFALNLRPGAFREYHQLQRPISQKTAAHGHFGREDEDFSWEKTDKAEMLREAAR